MRSLIIRRSVFGLAILFAFAGAVGAHAAVDLHLRTNAVGNNIVAVDSHNKFYGIVCSRGLIGSSTADLVFPNDNGDVAIETYRSSPGRSVAAEPRSKFVSLDKESTKNICNNPNGTYNLSLTVKEDKIIAATFVSSETLTAEVSQRRLRGF